MDESVLKSLFQGHHVITKDVANKSQLLVTLEEFDLFELNASQNILNLPGTQELAEKLNLSPHTGGPLSSYQKGINDLVDDLADTEDGQAAIAGDRAAAERVAGRVNTLRDTLKTALINGDLFTNTPKGITSEAINKLNQELLGKLDDYATKHADAISKMGKLVGPEAEWTAVLKSSEAVEEVSLYKVPALPAIFPGGGLPAAGSFIPLPVTGPMPSTRPKFIADPNIINGWGIGHFDFGDGTFSNPIEFPAGRPPLRPPVLLDLNGDGATDLRLYSANNNLGPQFDWNGDGNMDQTAWVGPKDGFLAIDLAKDGATGADGKIDQTRELAFSIWKTEDEIAAENAESVTDLEGLRYAFDTNRDNVLDANDARWNEFRVWQDLNQDGITDDGELKTMSEAGIKLINLLPDPAGAKQFADGSAITGTATATMTNGSTMMIADASLRFQPSMPTHLMS